MTGIFLKVLDLSISASFFILVVLLLRLLFQKAPKWSRGVLWALVGFRLIMPFSLESEYSLTPKSELETRYELQQNSNLDTNVSEQFSATGETQIEKTQIGENQIGEGDFKEENTPALENTSQLGSSVQNSEIGGGMLSVFWIQSQALFFKNINVIRNIWLLGVLGLLSYALISYRGLKKQVETAIPLKKGIYQSEFVKSPFVLGFFQPKIYLPFGLEKEGIKPIISHEKAHISRGDHWWKPLGFVILTLHWFNPLVWLSYILFCRDIELACDEKVIKEWDVEKRANYSQALLACSQKRGRITPCPLAFGEISVKKRVKNVLNYKKPAFWVILLLLAATLGASFFFLTEPVGEKAGENSTENQDPVVKDIVYYMELASKNPSQFQDMDEEEKNELTGQFGELLKDFTIVGRESTDKKTGYIVCEYKGVEGENPFNKLYLLDVSTQEENLMVLYQEEDYDAIDAAVLKGVIPEVGHIIRGMNIVYTENMVFLQPVGTEEYMGELFWSYNNPKKGPAYMEEAFSRGIALYDIAPPFLEIYRIDETYGEISEKIPLTQEQITTILSEERKDMPEGEGFCASLCLSDSTEIYSNWKGVTDTVVALAVEHGNYSFESPKDIVSPITEAKLEGDYLEAPIYLEKEKLARLEEILKNAKFDNSLGGCGYYTKLTITMENGETMVIFKGTDGCDTIAFGSYGGYLLGDAQNREFWEMFGLDIETKEPLN